MGVRKKEEVEQKIKTVVTGAIVERTSIEQAAEQFSLGQERGHDKVSSEQDCLKGHREGVQRDMDENIQRDGGTGEDKRKGEYSY